MNLVAFELTGADRASVIVAVCCVHVPFFRSLGLQRGWTMREILRPDLVAALAEDEAHARVRCAVCAGVAARILAVRPAPMLGDQIATARECI